MEPHPIPRQITTFEFKLIGFLTVKQFLYVVLFGGLGFLVFLLVQIPYLNIVSGLIIAGVGVIFALVKINERPLDVWVKNLIVRLTTPSQYFYKKSNDVPRIFQDLSRDPQIINTHIDAKNKVDNYLNTKQDKVGDQNNSTAQAQTFNIEPAMQEAVVEIRKEPLKLEVEARRDQDTNLATQQPIKQQISAYVVNDATEKAYLIGVVENSKGIKLPNIMVYVKDHESNPVRVLKTNSRGEFGLFRPLPSGDYKLEVRDLGNKYFFDTMNFQIASPEIPVELKIKSKEVV